MKILAVTVQDIENTKPWFTPAREKIIKLWFSVFIETDNLSIQCSERSTGISREKIIVSEGGIVEVLEVGDKGTVERHQEGRSAVTRVRIPEICRSQYRERRLTTASRSQNDEMTLSREIQHLPLSSNRCWQTDRCRHFGVQTL